LRRGRGITRAHHGAAPVCSPGRELSSRTPLIEQLRAIRAWLRLKRQSLRQRIRQERLVERLDEEIAEVKEWAAAGEEGQRG
jgi:hypothetical protein